MQKIKKAVFPVGGLGTRFLPATKALPKEMLPVASKPLIQHAFEEAVNAGFEEFIFITGRNKNVINNHFDYVYELEKALHDKDRHDALQLTRDWIPEPGKIAFVRQQHPLGLGHAVWCARNFIKDEPFAVILADELFIGYNGSSPLKDMAESYERNPGNIISVYEVDKDQTNKYGIIKPGKLLSELDMEIIDMVEKPKPEVAPSNLAIIGRYILQPEIFEYLEVTKKDVSGEIQLTDALKLMLKSTPTYGCKSTGKRFDCGAQLGFLEANIHFALQDDLIGENAKQLIKGLANSFEVA
ncbi:MAG: helicase [Candidatus Midichloriaceae bacterium]|jgi:UTP--glucose-1-phosphate uridylyltransferase|nr:helicase [Candidatus Midichloriaceae bacterium]